MKNLLLAALIIAVFGAASPALAADAKSDEKYCSTTDNKAACNATRKYLRDNYKAGADPKKAPLLPKDYNVKYASDAAEMRFLIMARIAQGLRASMG